MGDSVSSAPQSANSNSNDVQSASSSNGGSNEAPNNGNPNNGNPNNGNPNNVNPNANPNANNPFLAMFQGLQGMNVNPQNNGNAQPQPNPFMMFQNPFMMPQQQQQQPQQQANVQPEILYRDQLSQLNSMGFSDAAANIAALIATGGNVQAAIDRLLQGN